MTADRYHAMRAINRPYAPDEATADFIYQGYLLLKNAPLTFGAWAKQGALEDLAACADSWRVIGISEAALRMIAATGNGAGLRRGHWYPRALRFDTLFEPDAPVLARDDLTKFFYEHDTTVVIPAAQNNDRSDHTTWGRIIPVPKGLFPIGGYSVKVRKRTELPWVEERVAELDRLVPRPRSRRHSMVQVAS